MDVSPLVVSNTNELFDREEFSIARSRWSTSMVVYMSSNCPLKCIISRCNMHRTVATLSGLIRVY